MTIHIVHDSVVCRKRISSCTKLLQYFINYMPLYAFAFKFNIVLGDVDKICSLIGQWCIAVSENKKKQLMFHNDNRPCEP